VMRTRKLPDIVNRQRHAQTKPKIILYRILVNADEVVSVCKSDDVMTDTRLLSLRFEFTPARLVELISEMLFASNECESIRI
jgi:hypothetical protein